MDDFQELWIAGRYREIVARLEPGAEELADPDLLSLLARCDERLDRQKAALRWSRRAWILRRTDPALRFQVARAYAGCRRYEAARQRLVSLLDVDAPSLQANVRAALAMVYADCGRLNSAAQIIAEALEMAPDQAYVRACQSYVERRRVDFATARAAADRAIELEPEWSGAYVERALVQFHQGPLDSCLD
jgi:tetratricopeptide (TPR) repeat protein